MKIISGQAANLEIFTTNDLTVRPTLIRSRKALFDHLGNSIVGKNILDLFAGSGALGLEGASSGAAKVTFVEINPEHVKIIFNNIARIFKTKVKCDCQVKTCDASNYNAFKDNNKYDLISDVPFLQFSKKRYR